MKNKKLNYSTSQVALIATVVIGVRVMLEQIMPLRILSNIIKTVLDEYTKSKNDRIYEFDYQ